MSQSVSSKIKTFFKSMMKPSPAAVFQAVKSLKPHVPLIKFRYGAAGHHGITMPPPAHTPTASGSRSPSSSSKPNATVALPVIEDWQLPARYQRQPMDAKEIEYINRGGPE